MSLLQKSVDALTAAAGWKKASPGADGVFRFRLEGDLDMEFFSPDGRTGILRADLGPLPAAEQDADDLLRKCASSTHTVMSCWLYTALAMPVMPLAKKVESPTNERAFLPGSTTLKPCATVMPAPMHKHVSTTFKGFALPNV